MSFSSNFLSGIGWRKHFYHPWFWRVFRHPLRTMGLKYYKGAPKLQELELLDGRSLWLRVGTSDRSIVWEVFLKDNYCTERIEGRLACVVDIGAQIGLFSLKMAPRADRILMFEPEPENFKLLSRNLSGPRHEHVEKFNKAVARQAGKLRLYVAPDNPGAHTAFPATTSAVEKFQEVEAVRLPDILDARKISHIDYLKLDCEGAEYEIMASLAEWGLDRISYIGMEYHSVKDASTETHSGEAMEKLLRQHGFAVLRLPQRRHPDIGMLFAQRPPSPAR
jgi:FkbM family methyltransferase